jgi:nucleotide-binding universal stress UspA family protein
VLVANDGSEGAFKALSAGIELARRFGAELHMISVEEMPQFPASVDEIVEEQQEADRRFAPILERARAQAEAAHVRLHTRVVRGHAVSSIVDAIERMRCDLLLVGYMGHSALYNRLIGSTTDRLVELAPCAVLVVK